MIWAVVEKVSPCLKLNFVWFFYRIEEMIKLGNKGKKKQGFN